MNKQTEALKMAIDALEMSNELVSHGLIDFEQYNITEDKDIYIKILSAIDACEEALEQPTQEPIAHIKQGDTGYPVLIFNGRFEYASLTAKQPDIPLYTHPKEWQGLSDDEILDIKVKAGLGNWYDFSRAIEAKLKEKNHD